MSTLRELLCAGIVNKGVGESVNMTTHVRISEVCKATIEKVRDNGGHTNMDSALREIIMRSDVEMVPVEEIEDQDGEEEDDENGDESGEGDSLEDVW